MTSTHPGLLEENAGSDHYFFGRSSARIHSTETKASLKTTELIAYVGAVIAVIITALAVGGNGHGGADPFSALATIRYVTYLTIGYMVARGLAKDGSHEHYKDHNDAH